MTTIKCNNSTSKAVQFFPNGGNMNDIIVFAINGGDYWFTIGDGYKTIEGAKRAAIKKMALHGYTFNEAKMKALVIE